MPTEPFANRAAGFSLLGALTITLIDITSFTHNDGRRRICFPVLPNRVSPRACRCGSTTGNISPQIKPFCLSREEICCIEQFQSPLHSSPPPLRTTGFGRGQLRYALIQRAGSDKCHFVLPCHLSWRTPSTEQSTRFCRQPRGLKVSPIGPSCTSLQLRPATHLSAMPADVTAFLTHGVSFVTTH